MKYVLFPHGGSGNHGCEAIVRTTKKMISNEKSILFSNAIEEDYTYLGEKFIEILLPQKNVRRMSIEYIGAFVDYHCKNNKEAFDRLFFKPVISQCNKESILLSIGGDNYCYGENEYIYLVNRQARKQGSRTILWGASVEPEDISDKMAEDLKGYDLIVARESITYQILVELNKNTVLYPDPAFTLEREQGYMPKGLNDRPFIGINISPLIQSKEVKEGITERNYEFLIKGILDGTDYNIALIPHVVWNQNDDRVPLNKLYCKFKDTGRVFLVEDQNCMQLKDVISQCEFFVGARTHATIAAYSTCVPTLVVGYSVKARGIAKDIFGTDENYVISVQNLKKDMDLWQAFQWIQTNADGIREHLKRKMPEYIKCAKSAEKLLHNGV